MSCSLNDPEWTSVILNIQPFSLLASPTVLKLEWFFFKAVLSSLFYNAIAWNCDHQGKFIRYIILPYHYIYDIIPCVQSFTVFTSGNWKKKKKNIPKHGTTRHVDSKTLVCSFFSFMLCGSFWDTFSLVLWALSRKWRGLQLYHITQCSSILSHKCRLHKSYFPWNNNCFQHCKMEFYRIFFHSTEYEHNVLGTHTKQIVITWQ